MSTAVLGPRGRAQAAAAKFTRSGLYVIEDDVLGRHEHVDGVVLHAVRTKDFEEAFEVVESAHAPLTAGRASFQPVWSVWPSLGPLGFELHVVDDDDASAQLDAFFEALRDDSLLMGMKRSSVTISPRGGWNGYGHPEVTSRG